MATLQEIPLPLRSDESFEQELEYLSVNGSSTSGANARQGHRILYDEATEEPRAVSVSSTAETQLANSKAKDLLVEKALPPIKTRRDANDGGSDAPELSPPPSPKRMRELVRKTSLKNTAFSPVQTREDSL